MGNTDQVDLQELVDRDRRIVTGTDPLMDRFRDHTGDVDMEAYLKALYGVEDNE